MNDIIDQVDEPGDRSEQAGDINRSSTSTQAHNAGLWIAVGAGIGAGLGVATGWVWWPTAGIVTGTVAPSILGRIRTSVR